MANEGIELDIYDFRDPTKRLNSLEGRQQPAYLGEIGGVGGGSFTINRNDPKILKNPSLLQSRNVVKCKVDGKVVGGWVIQSRASTQVASGERSAEGFAISGEGLKTWFNDAEVYPAGGLKVTSKDNRSFSFASPRGDWYDSSAWILPKPLMRYTSIPGNPWKYLPANWPADVMPNARWVWGTNDDGYNKKPTSAAGNNYFRLTHTWSDSRSCSLYIAASNQYSVYLDGEQIAVSDPVTNRTTSTSYDAKKVDFDVDAGEHVIGIVVNNPVTNGSAGLLAGLVDYSLESPDINLGNVTVDIGVNARVHRVGHGLNNDDKVYLATTGVLPTGFTANRNYYVCDVKPDSFCLQATKTGVYIDTTGVQSGLVTLFKTGATANPRLITYTGMTQAFTKDNYNRARTTMNKARNHWAALPAGSSSSKAKKAAKLQAKKKAAALMVYTKARAKMWIQEQEMDLAYGNGSTWAVNPYPATVPGASAGEIMLTLLNEAKARGVSFPNWLHPTFTSFHDSFGMVWGDALDWTFPIGDSLADVVSKFADQGIDVWIDPDNYNLNMSIDRGFDRTVYQQLSNLNTKKSSQVAQLTLPLPQRFQDMVRSTDTNDFYVSQTDDHDNVVISRVNGAGTLISTMTLNGAGHGTTIDIEYIGGQVYIWICYNSGGNNHAKNDLVRFQYKTGTYTRDNLPNVKVFNKFGGDYVGVTFDRANDRMVLRVGAGQDTYQLRKISEFTNNINKVYGTISQGRGSGYSVLQGFFTYSNSLYIWYGSANTPADPPRLVQLNWSSGSQASVWDGSAFMSGPGAGAYWEPEGASLFWENGKPFAYIGMTYAAYPNHTYYVYKVPIDTDAGVQATPVIFDKGINLTKAETQSSGKIKNSVMMKTSNGWVPTPQQDAGSVSVYGVIESTLSTTTTVAATQSLAQQTIDEKATEEDGATYEFTPTDKIPWQDFNEGDWVLAPDEGLNRVARKIMSIALSETTSGAASYALEFDTIFQDNEARLGRAVKNLGGQSIGGSSSVSPTSLSPVKLTSTILSADSLLTPAVPDGLSVVTISGWDNNGSKPVTQAVVSWTPVQASEDGTSLHPTGYQVYARLVDEDDPTVIFDPTDDQTSDPINSTYYAQSIQDSSDGDSDPDPEDTNDPNIDEAQNPWQVVGTSINPVTTVGHFDPLTTWAFAVRAVNGGLTSDLSDIVTVPMDSPELPPDEPTTPVVDSKLGVMTINWDGYLRPATGGTALPDKQFRYVYPGLSEVAGGPYIAMGTSAMTKDEQMLITGLSIGVTYYIVLYAIDGVGLISNHSDEASTTLKGVDLGSLEQDVKDAVAAANGAAAAASALASQATTIANTAEAAAVAAQTSSDGKNAVTYSTNAASGSGKTNGDLWWQVDNNHSVIAWWVWNGTAWVSQTLNPTIIPSLDAGKITSGYINANLLQANSINASALVSGSVTATQIAGLTITGDKIQGGTIVGDKIQGNTITGDKLQANTITANQIAAGTIVTNNLNAGAIDGMVITSALFRTSQTATTTGIQIDSSGIHAYSGGGSPKLTIDIYGNLTASNANITGTVNATQGSITGTLAMSSTGKITSPQGVYPNYVLDNTGLTVHGTSSFTMQIAGDFDGNAEGISWDAAGAAVGQLYGTSGGQVTLWGGANSSGDINLGSDGSGGRVWSDAIRYRSYATSNRTSGTGNMIMVNTQAGTIGTLTGVIDSTYLSSSSRDSKHDIEPWNPDPKAILAIDPVSYRYNDDNSLHVGMIAEQLEELGLGILVPKDDNGKPTNIEYLFFGAALLALAKDQDRRIAQLEKQLAKE